MPDEHRSNVLLAGDQPRAEVVGRDDREERLLRDAVDELASWPLQRSGDEVRARLQRQLLELAHGCGALAELDAVERLVEGEIRGQCDVLTPERGVDSELQPQAVRAKRRRRLEAHPD